MKHSSIARFRLTVAEILAARGSSILPLGAKAKTTTMALTITYIHPCDSDCIFYSLTDFIPLQLQWPHLQASRFSLGLECSSLHSHLAHFLQVPAQMSPSQGDLVESSIKNIIPNLQSLFTFSTLKLFSIVLLFSNI